MKKSDIFNSVTVCYNADEHGFYRVYFPIKKTYRDYISKKYAIECAIAYSELYGVLFRVYVWDRKGVYNWQ